MDTKEWFILVAVTLQLPRDTIEQQDPEPLPWEQWAEFKAYSHLINLTEFIARDATYKLRHADKVQEKHRHSITYELGTIAAGVLDHFKKMLRIYRKYSDEQAFIRMDHYVWEYLYAFHHIQGEYHEIRMEQGMFYDIVKDYEATMGGTTKFTLPPGFTIPPRGARRFVIDSQNGSLKYVKPLKSKTRVSTKMYRRLPWEISTKKLWQPA